MPVRWGGGRGNFEKTSIAGYALKADIRHYFDTVDHETLLKIVEHRIKDQNVIGLIKRILENHETPVKGVGMPIGNLTSQFFANVYLHQLDLFVKHQLKAKYYIRYVDDFVILHKDKRMLQIWEDRINEFLRESLKIELHPDKTKNHKTGPRGNPPRFPDIRRLPPAQEKQYKKDMETVRQVQRRL